MQPQMNSGSEFFQETFYAFVGFAEPFENLWMIKIVRDVFEETFLQRILLEIKCEHLPIHFSSQLFFGKEVGDIGTRSELGKWEFG